MAGGIKSKRGRVSTLSKQKRDAENQYCGAMLEFREVAQKRGFEFREAMMQAMKMWIESPQPETPTCES